MIQTSSEIRQALKDFELRELFNSLGWDNSSDQQYITVTDSDGEDSWYELNAVAQKRKMMVFTVVARPDESLPDAATRKKIERELTKLYTEHFIVYASADKREQVWQWVKRQSGSPAMVREQRFTDGNPTENLVQRLQGISFSIEEEDELGELDVFGRVQANFDVERLTKRFYESFKKEHDAFLAFIEGLDDMEEKQWYASIMLNRLMFVYFVQRKGFLDGNQNYLRDKLAQMRSEGVEGNFLTFYRQFLLKLFLKGLGQAESNREPEVDRLIGDIPYLNGGLFDVHSIEEENPDLDIPDEAFERVFDFFDRYDWHLDERPLKNNNEINADVLGYIFEKYINQKQMGAYYTQEDVTGYITQNTVIPYLFDATEKECHIAFRPGSSMWELLADTPDRYIYDAVLKGVDTPLPDEIAAGIDDVSERGLWNRAADEEYALPTETWREHVARRERCEELRRKMMDGEVKSIDELVTLNLNIRQFAEDAIINCEGADFLRAFYKAVREISVLDPTCGSGAFLFAALNVLEALYDACLERMEQFVEEDSTGERYQDFRENLAEVEDHTSREYFILKSIVVRNLYGVDIMEEAVEIARLRLFLKLMAQIENRDDIEPLPDLDFNLRAGNTLVGFSSMDEVRRTLERKLDFGGSTEKIEEGAAAADDSFQRFRRMQMDDSGTTDSEEFAPAKAELRERLGDLNAELDKYLAVEYGVEADKEEQLTAWQESHQPFHWLVEFYGTIQSGGFDVIVGNPPYIELKSFKDYSFIGYSSIKSGNLYALVVEQCVSLCQADGRQGYIVPVSSVSTDRYETLQELLEKYQLHYASFDDRPSRLFDGIEHSRLTVHIFGPKHHEPRLYSTRYNKWRAEERPELMKNLVHTEVKQGFVENSFPKLCSAVEANIMEKLAAQKAQLARFYSKSGPYEVYYSRKVGYFLQVLDFQPKVLDGNGNLRPPSEFKKLQFDNERLATGALCALNSNLFYWFITVFSDCRHVNKREVDAFPINLSAIAQGKLIGRLQEIGALLMISLDKNSEARQMRFSHDTLTIQFLYPRESKPIINEIDRILAEHYGFTDEELDFIINYDIKYRMGIEEG